MTAQPTHQRQPINSGQLRKDVVGHRGEQRAQEYLVSLGYRILQVNWRSPTGELDIVALDARQLVICEVKTRTSDRYGTPREAVTEAKERRIRRLAMQWVKTARPPGVRWSSVRYDVIGVIAPRYGDMRVTHLMAAF